jgi:hypothetical protein
LTVQIPGSIIRLRRGIVGIERGFTGQQRDFNSGLIYFKARYG